MKREIKFRAWYDPGESGYEVMLYDRGDLSEFFDAAEACLVMQYTGLKDKNGKEVYEGDIILFKDYHKGLRTRNGVEEEVWDAVSVVRYVEDKAKFHAFEVDDRCATGMFQNWMSYSFEVIGNIYENPELISDLKCSVCGKTLTDRTGWCKVGGVPFCMQCFATSHGGTYTEEDGKATFSGLNV